MRMLACTTACSMSPPWLHLIPFLKKPDLLALSCRLTHTHYTDIFVTARTNHCTWLHMHIYVPPNHLTVATGSLGSKPTSVAKLHVNLTMRKSPRSFQCCESSTITWLPVSGQPNQPYSPPQKYNQGIHMASINACWLHYVHHMETVV